MIDIAHLQARAAAAHGWLRDQVWPLWRDRGIDPGRGFHEHLSHAALSCDAPFRRLRVVARQIVVFSAAAAEGVPGAEAAVRLGGDFLVRTAAHPEGGYAWRFDLAGAPVDLTRDLYDHAFVLLALAHAAPFLAPDAASAGAQALDRLLQTCFAHPGAGYHESLPPAQPRRQNPHMHLLEATLAAAEAWGAEPWLDRAEALVALFLDQLFQPADAAVAEFFTDDWRPLREHGRFVAEPGHHAEWIWLLSRYRRLTSGRGRSAEIAAAIGALAAFLRRPACYGANGALVDALWSDGTRHTDSARLWPQTERLKAEILLPQPSFARIDDAFSALWRFIDGAPPGLWFERWTPQRGFHGDRAPASSVYHLTVGILEAEKALGRL